MHEQHAHASRFTTRLIGFPNFDAEHVEYVPYVLIEIIGRRSGQNKKMDQILSKTKNSLFKTKKDLYKWDLIAAKIVIEHRIIITFNHPK